MPAWLTVMADSPGGYMNHTAQAASVRASFVARFSEDQAAAIERAAQEHMNGVHDNKGSDPFKWAFLVAIGYECISKDSYRAYHSITAPLAAMKEWARTEAHLASHDGDCDYLAAFVGAYSEYLPEERTQ